MCEIVLIRGLPGSGKTTKAKTDFPDHQHVEADMYFKDTTGVYKYDVSKIQNAHQWCQTITKQWLHMGYSVVVANTFTRIWEMQPYFDMGYPVRVIEANGNYDDVHGVPSEKIERMRERFEAYPCQQTQQRTQ